MATYTNLINSVLLRLRETQVAAPGASTYALLIGEFVNQAKEEVENAWKWGALRSTVDVTTVQGTTSYALTGAGTRYKLQDDMFSVFDATNEGYLMRRSDAWVKKNIRVNTNQSKSQYFYLDGVDSNGDGQITIYPPPEGVTTINVDLIIPQAVFTLGTEILSVPSEPVKLKALVLALAERGEDQGNTHGEAGPNYTNSLNDAIAIDAAKYPDEVNWYIN
jgi:hypothetical protein